MTSSMLWTSLLPMFQTRRPAVSTLFFEPDEILVGRRVAAGGDIDVARAQLIDELQIFIGRIGGHLHRNLDAGRPGARRRRLYLRWARRRLPTRSRGSLCRIPGVQWELS